MLEPRIGNKLWLMCLVSGLFTAFAVPVVAQDSPPAATTPSEREQRVQSLHREVSKLFAQGDFARAAERAELLKELVKELQGEEHPNYSAALNNLAVLYKLQGKYPQAESLFKEALAIKKKTLGERHPDFATSLLNLARLYEIQGDYQEAERLMQQGVEIYREAYGEDHPEYANGLCVLAAVCEAKADYSRAETLLQQALTIYRMAQGAEQPGYAVALGRLAELYQIKGDFARAEQSYQESLAVRRQTLGEAHPDTAANVNNLATLYASQADYGRAEQLYRQALEALRRTVGEHHPDYAATLNNLGALLLQQGDYGYATVLFEQALTIYKLALGEQHPMYARILQNQAQAYQDMDDHGRAESLTRQALEIKKQKLGKDHPDVATTMNNLGSIYEQQGDYDRAEELYRQALAITRQVFGEGHADYATRLGNLAGLYMKQAEYDRAEPICRQALEITKQALGESHPDYALRLDQLAEVLRFQRDWPGSEQLYREAMATSKKALGEDHLDYSTRLNNLASLYFLRGDYEQAEPLFQQALQIRKRCVGEQHTKYAQSLNNLAFLFAAKRDRARAESFARQSLEITKHSLAVAAAAQSGRQQLNMMQAMRLYLDSYVSIAFDDDEFKQRAIEELLNWKGAVFRRHQQLREVSSNPALAPTFAELQSVSARLANLAFSVPQPAQQQAWRGQIRELTERKEDLEANLAKASMVFNEIGRVTTLGELQSVLPNDHVLVDFLVIKAPRFTGRKTPASDLDLRQTATEERLVAFVVRSNSLVSLDFGSAATINKWITAWRTSFASSEPDDGKAGDEAARALRRLLWLPLEKHFKGVHTVLISPDGPLNQLPLAALPGAKPRSFLIEEFAFSVVSVPQLLTRMFDSNEEVAVDANDHTPSLLVVGDVDFDGDAGRVALAENSAPERPRSAFGAHDANYSPLPGTQGELVAIAKLFAATYPNSKVRQIFGADAIEARFREEAPQYRSLHLATHGFFAPPEQRETQRKQQGDDGVGGWSFGSAEAIVGVHPDLQSGLVLAGANRRRSTEEALTIAALDRVPDDGILTALEVGNLDLRGTELAVLSACETGLGAVAGGEGVLGLQRAFQIAGTRTTVTSLWKVHDDATRVLMTEFYKNLWQRKLSKLEALREAQLKMLHDYDVQSGVLRSPGQLVQGDPKRRDTTRKPASPSGLPPRYWAAFVLSGDWR
ncbi:MAG: tetratricopeptide repeat protein [Pirellulales bacterium]|nr:tetratricopeptide repeat protein [Pirellulales bacterium]